nr:hypothetical protein [Tanacetum cinerariifolium]
MTGGALTHPAHHLTGRTAMKTVTIAVGGKSKSPGIFQLEAEKHGVCTWSRRDRDQLIHSGLYMLCTVISGGISSFCFIR